MQGTENEEYVMMLNRVIKSSLDCVTLTPEEALENIEINVGD